MSVVQLRPHQATRATAMNAIRQRWQNEIEADRFALDEALKEATALAAAAVTVAHRIDELHARIEMRSANLAKYQP